MEFPWCETDSYARCRVRRHGRHYALYVGRLPGRAKEWCWYLRQDSRVLAAGIACCSGQAFARAEHACTAWDDLLQTRGG